MSLRNKLIERHGGFPCKTNIRYPVLVVESSYILPLPPCIKEHVFDLELAAAVHKYVKSKHIYIKYI